MLAVGLALAAVVVVVLGVTPLGNAAPRVVRFALFAKDAGSVNGIKASRKAKPGRLVALGADGTFPASIMPAGASGSAGPPGPMGGVRAGRAAGAAGERGEKGEKGDPGKDAARHWAVVAADGTLVRGSGVTSVRKTGTGTFELVFDAPVAACAHLATIGATDGATLPPTGQITVGPSPDGEGIVRLETETSTGANADRSFHMAVLC